MNEDITEFEGKELQAGGRYQEKTNASIIFITCRLLG